MAELKKVISLLCSYINSLIGFEIKAEHFRLAKFNEGDTSVVKLFWNLLVKVIEFSELLPDNHFLHYDDNTAIEGKLCLAALGYKSVQFYYLPQDLMFGSRELLLAIGWLIAEKHILELCFQKKIRQSDLSMEMKTGNVKKQEPEATTKHQVELSVRDLLKSITWLSGKIHHDIKSVADLNDQRIKVFNRLHCIDGHQSVCEMMMTDEKAAMDYYERNKHVLDLISERKEWRRNSPLFWKWMDSVLAEREKSTFHLSEQNIMTFLNVFGDKLQYYLSQKNHPQVESVKGVQGMVRHILISEGQQTNIERWRTDLEELLKETRKKHKRIKHDTNMELISLLGRIENISISLSNVVL